MVLSMMVCLAYAQENLIFEKLNFKDVLCTAEDVYFIGNKATLNWTESKYSNLFSDFGNMNKINQDIPVGDFQICYDYTVIPDKKNAAVGMSYGTFYEESKEFFMFSYMLTTEGDILYYYKKAANYYTKVPENEFVTEKCAALNPSPLKNSVTIERKGRIWTLKVNAVVVKTIEEPAYGSGDKQINEPGGIFKAFSNVLLLKGKQEIEFSDCSQRFYVLQTDFDRDVKFLSNFTGNYSLKPHCSIGSAQNGFDISVRYLTENRRHMVAISGITSDTIKYCLTSDFYKKEWKCKLDKEDYVVIDNEKYEIKQFYFKQIDNSDQIMVGVELSNYTVDYSTNAQYTFDCTFYDFKTIK